MRINLDILGAGLTVSVLGAVILFSPIPSGKDYAQTQSAPETEAPYIAAPTAAEENIEHCTDPVSAYVDKVDYSVDYGAGDAYLLAKIASSTRMAQGILWLIMLTWH